MILPASTASLQNAVRLLRDGQAVALPTETVYGLAADALRPEAAARIFAIKQRPTFDPLIVHVLDAIAARHLATDWPESAAVLAAAFWPGPLTLVLPKHPSIPDLVTSGLPHVALRVSAHPVMREVLHDFGGPLAAPSANRFGRISPTTAAAVETELGEAVPLILDGGSCQVGLESTIISLVNKTPLLLRAGGIPVETIEALVGPVTRSNAVETQPLAPGQLTHHYAPGKSLHLVDTAETLPREGRHELGLLWWGQDLPAGFGHALNLSPSGDLTEAATAFFRMLRALDDGPARQLCARTLPNEGLGVAMNERLQRASTRP